MTGTQRERLLLALAEVLTERPRLPMEQVAQAVGISRATLHRMFPSREAVIAAILESALENGMRTIEDAELERGPADEALARLLSASMPYAALHLFLVSNRSERCESSAEIDQRWEPHRQRLLALLRRGQEEEVLRVDLSAQWMLDAMGALLFAAVESTRAGRLAPASATEAVLGMFMDGVRRRSR